MSPCFLVDTSVWIDLFRQRTSSATEKLYELLEQSEVFGLTDLIYQEVLQGALHEQDFQALTRYLGAQTFYQPKQEQASYGAAAKLYFDCRRQGITIRSTVDCLIAQIAIEHELILLHNDKDFVRMAAIAPQLLLYPH